MQTKASRVFEVSFEVCNKVGGIYTVVSSKAKILKERYWDFMLIGPYIEHQARQEFKQTTPPNEIRSAFDALSGLGLTFHYGRWLIKGAPTVILIEFSGAFKDLNEYKHLFWEKFGLDSLNAGYDYDEPFAFSLAAGKLIEQIIKNDSVPSVCHTHEWMTGFTALYLKARNVKIGTVFTTHATMLGRAICGSGEDLYTIMHHMNADEKARQHNVYAKYSAEKACASYVDVFTTVSQLTGEEAEKVLGKKADVLLINGLDAEQYPPFEDASILHVQSRERLREFCMYYFFPYYTFDIEHTLFFYTSGRHEVHNKGIDITIEALARLNQQLKAENTTRTVVAFFWVPHATYGVRADVLENKTYYRHIKNYLTRHNEELHKSIIQRIFLEGGMEKQDIFSEEFYQQVNKLRTSFKREGLPPLSPFICDERNEIISLFYKFGLLNHHDDRVKVVLYPTYLTGLDGMLDFTYNEAIAGCHLGLFPSYYEPWGYTPAESIALGVPAVTSDLAGFGRFVKDNNGGVYVLERQGKPHGQVIDSYAKTLADFSRLDRTQRIDEKINAKRLSLRTNWATLIENYIVAHNLAIDRMND